MSIARLTQLQTEINRIVEVMIESYKPLKIILYGSVAKGSVHEYSDIDLMVIKDTDKSFYERLEEVIEITKPNVATEIIVYTPEEANNFADDFFFQEEILKKGKVIFSAK